MGCRGGHCEAYPSTVSQKVVLPAFAGMTEKWMLEPFTGASSLKCRCARAEGTDADACQALDAFGFVVGNLACGAVFDFQRSGATVWDAVAAMGASFLVAHDPLPGRVDCDVEGLYKIDCAPDRLFRARDIQHEIPFLFRGDLCPIDIDDKLIIFHQVVNDRFVTDAFGKVEHQFSGDGFVFHRRSLLFTSGFIFASLRRGASGAASWKSPLRSSSASRFAIYNALG